MRPIRPRNRRRARGLPLGHLRRIILIRTLHVAAAPVLDVRDRSGDAAESALAMHRLLEVGMLF